MLLRGRKKVSALYLPRGVGRCKEFLRVSHRRGVGFNMLFLPKDIIYEEKGGLRWQLGTSSSDALWWWWIFRNGGETNMTRGEPHRAWLPEEMFLLSCCFFVEDDFRLCSSSF